MDVGGERWEEEWKCRREFIYRDEQVWWVVDGLNPLSRSPSYHSFGSIILTTIYPGILSQIINIDYPGTFSDLFL